MVSDPVWVVGLMGAVGLASVAGVCRWWLRRRRPQGLTVGTQLSDMREALRER